MKLFLDANVLFTAAYSPTGRSRALFRLAAAGCCTLVSSRHALEEARRNLALKAPEAAPELESLLDSVDLVAEADLRLVSWALALGLPANDAPILAAALASAADALVTGDRRHFGGLYGSSPKGVLVLSPAAALERLLADPADAAPPESTPG